MIKIEFKIDLLSLYLMFKGEVDFALFSNLKFFKVLKLIPLFFYSFFGLIFYLFFYLQFLSYFTVLKFSRESSYLLNYY